MIYTHKNDVSLEGGMNWFLSELRLVMWLHHKRIKQRDIAKTWETLRLKILGNRAVKKG